MLMLWCATLSIWSQTAEIKNVIVDEEARDSPSNTEGVRVTADVRIQGMKNKAVWVGFFVYDANKDLWCFERNGRQPYSAMWLEDQKHAVCSWDFYNPSSDDTGWIKISRYLSKEQLHLKKGNNMYYCKVKVWTRGTEEVLAQSKFIGFTSYRSSSVWGTVGFAYKPQNTNRPATKEPKSNISAPASTKASRSSSSSSSSSKMTNRSSQGYFDDSFQTISRYNVQGSYISLEKKLNMSDYRSNGDGKRFYRTTLAVTITDRGNSQRTILDTDLYTVSDFWKAALPCMMVDPKNEVLYIFANSKSSDRYYGMDGYAYRLDNRAKVWRRETVFSGANHGWYSFFGGSNNGNPELWHFSYAGYYAMKSVRSSNGSWSCQTMGSITPQNADAQYASHDNILVSSNSGVDRMNYGGSNSSNSYARSSRSSSNSIIPGISDKALATGAAVVGTGAILYGIFKLFTAGGSSSSSSSSSYSSSSYSSSSSRYSSSTYSNHDNNSSSNNTNSRQADRTIDPETVDIPAWKITGKEKRDDSGVVGALTVMRGMRYFIQFDDGTTCKVEQHDDVKNYWLSNSVNEYYSSLQYAVEAGYVMEKYSKKRRKGMKD